MRRFFTALVSSLGILLGVNGCSESPGPTNLDPALMALSDISASIVGNVVTADSIPAARARVLIYLVAPVPPDSTPPDTVPPDTTPPDTLPPDTTGVSPTDEASVLAILASDSLPGDSTPPPPPAQCGDRGQLVARTRSDRNGIFQVTGLAPGIYDIRGKAGAERGVACGAIVRSGQQVFVTLILARKRR
jgi:hypothetical protein